LSSPKASRRFRVDAIAPDASGVLDPGAAVHRHLRVLRAEPGFVVHLFDGRGVEVEAEIVAIDDDSTTLRVVSELLSEVESALDICLVQAIPVRSARMDTIVRQVTELGVQRIVPVIAERSQPAKGRPAPRERKAERWRRIAGSAAEQSRRSRVPRIDSPCPVTDVDWGSLPQPIFIAHRETIGAVAPLEDGTAELGATVMVGPEGGWTDGELEIAAAAGAQMLRLGPRMLRADTAGVVTITLLQYLWGDLRDG